LWVVYWWPLTTSYHKQRQQMRVQQWSCTCSSFLFEPHNLRPFQIPQVTDMIETGLHGNAMLLLTHLYSESLYITISLVTNWNIEPRNQQNKLSSQCLQDKGKEIEQQSDPHQFMIWFWQYDYLYPYLHTT
jgi:hypothetical protein